MNIAQTNTPESRAELRPPFDELFFHVVSRIFRPEFLYGAGVLLGTYDDEALP